MKSNTTYYLRPFVINREETVYGEQVMVKTPPMVFDVRVIPLELWDGYPWEENLQGPDEHESGGKIYVQVEDDPASKRTLSDWHNTFHLYMNIWNDIDLHSTEQTVTLNETQSIQLPFDLYDYDHTGNANDHMDHGTGIYSMSKLLGLTNHSPGSGSTGIYEIPRDSAIIGDDNYLKLTFQFSFTER